MVKTVASLIDTTPIRNITINEDSVKLDYDPNYFMDAWPTTHILHSNGIGQHASITEYLESRGEKYYLHSEEDWFYSANYDWVGISLKLMEEHPNVIKVLARKGSPHPCKHDRLVQAIHYGFLEPWENEGSVWSGFSWNPGVTRMDLLKEFIQFPKYEQELAERIYAKGYRVIELGIPAYEHIGEGRSTH